MFKDQFSKYIAIMLTWTIAIPMTSISVQAAAITDSKPASMESSAQSAQVIDADRTESEDLQEIKVRSSDVDAASEGCVLVSVDGRFEEADAEEILARLNEIRYEACSEGVMNPKDGEPLTPEDYVPLKWSTDLENRALTRAAEASLLMDHTRPNGQSCFTFAESGIPATNETLAWGYGGIIESVNGWYSEKEAYLAQTEGLSASLSGDIGGDADASLSGKDDASQTADPADELTVGVTSHYVALINPDNLYVGAADFGISGQRDACAAEFTSELPTGESADNGAVSSEDNTKSAGEAAASEVTVSEAQTGSYGFYRQQVEVKAEDLSLTQVKGKSFVRTGAEEKYETSLVYVGDDGPGQLVEPVDGYVFSSSDEAVLEFYRETSGDSADSASSNPAAAAAKQEGLAIVTAGLAGGPETLTAELTVEVSDDIAENAGWNETERGLQYRKASGEPVEDKWLKIDGEWYRLDSEGYAQTGWYSEKDQWYYFDESGAMVKGWLVSDGNWYYMSRTEGKLQTGWVEFRGRWYYLSTRRGGAMYTGWLENEGATYYLDKDGARVTGETEIDGNTYVFSEDGKLVIQK